MCGVEHIVRGDIRASGKIDFDHTNLWWVVTIYLTPSPSSWNFIFSGTKNQFWLLIFSDKSLRVYASIFHKISSYFSFLALLNISRGQFPKYQNDLRDSELHFYIREIFRIQIHDQVFWLHYSQPREKLKVFFSFKTSSAYLKSPIYLFSDVWSVHELIRSNIENGGT